MTNINDLFQSALDDGTLSNESLQALTVYDLGAQIQAGLGIHVDDVMSSEVVLVTIMPDDSGSIQYAGNAQAVRGGHNSVLDALTSSQQQDNILIHNRYLNGNVLYQYCPIAQAIRMDTKNYTPNQGTPLYDQAVVLLGTVLAPKLAKKVYLLEDCTSPVVVPNVVDFTDQADAAFQRFANAGMHLVKSTDAMETWVDLNLA